MQNQVIFRDRQEIQAKDLNNVQTFAADTFAAVLKDGITPERKFTGLAIAATSATEITVDAGRLYHQGTVYGRGASSAFNLFTYLPVATKKVIAVVAWGQNVDAATEPRDFLIDLTTGATEPQAVPMENRNQVEINLVSGVESADPVAPAVPDNTVVVAYITMNTTGIENIDFQIGNQLPNVRDNQQGIATLNTWKNRIGPQIEAIQTNIVALAERTDGKADRSSVQFIASDVARLKERNNLPDSYSMYGADRFADADESDTAVAGYDAHIKNSLTFPFAASANATLSLFNPFDDRVKRSATDWVLPTYTDEAKIKITGYNGDVSMSQYQVETHHIETYTYYQYYWGWNWSYYSNYWWWYYGYGYYPWYYWGYYGYYWYQYPVTAYRDVTTTTSYNGVIVGQTILTPNAFWLTSVDMYLTQVATSGSITVVLCETDYGKPNLAKSLAVATIAQADLKRYPTETRVEIPPTWVEAGKRYAVMFITEGAHRIATVSGNDYTQGTYFYGHDGDFFNGDITKNLMFNVNGAAFAQPRTEVVLGNVSLAGGITDLEIATEAVVPDGTSLSYEVQIGGRWYALEQANLIATTPDILPMRAIMVGTRDAAPGFKVGANRVLVSRPKTTMQHVSTLRTLPGSTTTTNVTVTLLVSGYDAGNHTVTPKLLNSSNVVIANPSVVTYDTEYTNGQETVTRVTATFTLGTAAHDYKVEILGTRSSSTAPFRVLERMDVAI